ncbi:MAG: TlyA family RNA methyltransferase [Nitrospinales bacterium]
MRIGDEIVDKAGRLFPEDCQPQVEEPLPYVSRGGVKLAHALATFGLSPAGKTALDIGASTGGFTDCLLQNGAVKVIAIDVGYGQLDWKLRNDSRVVLLDRTNARYLMPEQLGEPADLAVIDVSFISLKLIIPPVLNLLLPEADLVALVKPQFEVGKDEVEKKGIIKDTGKHLKVLLGLNAFVQEHGWVLRDLTASPITGQKGNREFLIHCVNKNRGEAVSEESIRKTVLNVEEI